MLALSPARGTTADVALVTALKLLANPLLAWLGGRYLIPLPPDRLAAVTLLAAMPTAATVFVLAERYELWVLRASTAILLTHIGSVATLGVLLYALGRWRSSAARRRRCWRLSGGAAGAGAAGSGSDVSLRVRPCARRGRRASGAGPGWRRRRTRAGAGGRRAGPRAPGGPGGGRARPGRGSGRAWRGRAGGRPRRVPQPRLGFGRAVGGVERGGVERAEAAQAPGGEGQLLDPVLLGRVGGGVAGEEGGAEAPVGGGVLAGEEAEGAGEAVAGAVQGGAGLALGGGGAAGEGAVGAGGGGLGGGRGEGHGGLDGG